MASFDGAYESLVQGVSEQVPTSRLPGQVTEQVNMVSDLVTGVRRRTGSKLRFTMKSEGIGKNLKAWKTDVGGVSTECYLNTNTGELILLEEGNVSEMTRFQSDYLRAMTTRAIRHAGVGDSLFIANIEQIPTAVYDEELKIPYRSGGFFEVVGSNINQTFNVTVTGGGRTFTGSYTTPNGRDPSHATYSSTSFVAERLSAGLQGEQWIFPPSEQGELKQDSPYTEANDNALSGGADIVNTYNSSILLTGVDIQDFKIEMPEGYVSVVAEVSGRVRVNILRSSPSTTYKLNWKGKPWTYKTPSGVMEEHNEWLKISYITRALSNSMRGEDTIIPPYRYEVVQGLPEPPPNIIEDPDNDFLDFYEIALVGSRVFIKSKDGAPIAVTTGTGKIYVETSNAGILERVNELPATLPTIADGAILAVGTTGVDLTYFRFNYGESRWEETSLPGSPSGVKDMPIEIYWDGDKWVMLEEPFEGRTAGDDTSNPSPGFIDWGITGVSSYQGRLVILSGSWAYLSATNAPRSFYRTTVAELLDSDPIGIGSSSASSASFEYGVVFNKDLVLFSPEHQASIPGLNQALTPRNAHILVTSTYTADMSSEPVTLGSSLMYPIPRSSTHYGIMEMIPSTYTDSAYSSSDASEHIPRYMQGRCRFAVSSTVGGMVLFGSSENRRVLYVHEYLWAGDEKVLRSWHRWEFETDIAYAFFSGGLINLVTVNPESGHILVSNIDPKASDGSTVKAAAYYMDNHTVLKVNRDEDVTVTLPACYSNYVKSNGLEDKLTVAYYDTDLNSMQIGSELLEDGKTIKLNPSTTAEKVLVGIPFESKLVPSPPVFKDFLDRPIVFNRVQLMKMYAMTDNTGIFTVEVRDKPRSYDTGYEVNPTRWLSTDLNLGRLPVGGTLGAIIPTRVDANTAEISFISNGLDEMNIINLEYTCKSGTMRKRR